MITDLGKISARKLLDFVNLDAERARPQPRTGASTEYLG